MCMFVDSKVFEGIVLRSSSLSRRTQVESDCGNPLKDCSLRLGGWPMAWDTIFYDVFLFIQLLVLEGEVMRCVSVGR